jgi:hypothetical protein
MGLEGQFRRTPHSLGRFINEPVAAAFIYSAVLAGWTFSGLASLRLGWGIVVSGTLFVVSFCAIWGFYRYVRED